MKNLCKKLLIILLTSFCMIASLILGGGVPNITSAEGAISYLYKNDGNYTVTAALPKYFATHYTASNMSGAHPYQYSVGSGVADTYKISDEQLILTSKSNQVSKAVNLTFSNSIPDIELIKNLTINMTVSTNGKTRRKLIMQSGTEWFTLYGVNADGKINNDNIGYELTNTNIPALNTEISLVLSREEIQLLANSDGGIQTIQWNFWDESKNISLIISSISYELASPSELNEVVFKDFNGNTLKTVYAGAKLAKEYFPTKNDFPDIPEGKTLAWKDASGKDYNIGTAITGDLVLYPTCVKDRDAFTYTFYGNGNNSVSASYPISFISDQAEAETMMFKNGGIFNMLYSIGQESFSMNFYAGYRYGAVDYKFATPLTNLSNVKKLVLNMTIAPYSNYSDLIPDYGGTSPYYRLYPLNTDGTVDKSRYFAFNDQTVSTLYDEVEIVLEHDQLSLLANENGEITGWQFNCFQFDWAPGQVLAKFAVHSIEYELFADFEYSNVRFYDTDGVTVLDSVVTPYTLTSVAKDFPDSSVTNYPRDGYVLRWYTQPNGEGELVDKTTVFNGGDVALYAHFDRVLYSITYDYNGSGYIGDGGKAAYYGESVKKPSDPTRGGYTFAGWYEVGATETFNFNAMVNRNVTLVAKWIPDSFNLTLNAANGSTIITENSSNQILYGTMFTFQVTVEEGYFLSAVYFEVAGERFTPTLNQDGSYSFLVIAGDTTLCTEVAEKYIPFNDILVSGGRLTCEQTIRYGESAEFIVKTVEGFQLKKLTLNGNNVMHLVKNGKLVIENVSGELNFEIEFEPINKTGSCSSSMQYGMCISLFAASVLALMVKGKKRGEE